MSTIKAALLESWSEWYDLAGVSITVAGQELEAIQTAEEAEALDTPFDAPSRMWESELGIRESDFDAAGIRQETPLLWAGKRWRVRSIRRHSGSPIVLARVVREA